MHSSVVVDLPSVLLPFWHPIWHCTEVGVCFSLHRFIDRGEFGEVYQGTAIDILGPDAGPTPVAVKVGEDSSSLRDCCAWRWYYNIVCVHTSTLTIV